MTLDQKVAKAIKIYKDAFKKFTGVNKIIGFTGGKDSTVLLELAKMAFGKIPCKVFYIDSGLDHKETEEFIDFAVMHWGLDILKVVDEKALAKVKAEKDKGKRATLARMLKIATINKVVKMGYGVIVAGIRWDEHEARSKEKPISPRKNHTRVHPILHFTEDDIWKFIEKYDIPCNPLYSQGYRSLGEEEFTEKVTEPDGSERSGRDPDKELIMERLRQLGYF